MDDITNEQMIKEARREARRLSKAGRGTHQECLDIVARNAGRKHWGDFMQNPVDIRAGLPANRQASQNALEITYSILTVIPVIGSILQVLAHATYAGPQTKADRKWMLDIVQRMKALEERDQIDVEKLAQDPRFERVVRRIVGEIPKEGDDSKRSAYKAVVINYAMGRTFDEAVEKRLLSCLERYTGLHLEILDLMQDPTKRFPDGGMNRMMSSMPGMLRDAFPDVKADHLESAYTEMMDDGLLSKMTYHIMMSGTGAYASRISNLGRAMLRMIEMPEQADQG